MSAHREVVAKLEPATLTHPAGAASAGGVFYWARAFGAAQGRRGLSSGITSAGANHLEASGQGPSNA